MSAVRPALSTARCTQSAGCTSASRGPRPAEPGSAVGRPLAARTGPGRAYLQTPLCSRFTSWRRNHRWLGSVHGVPDAQLSIVVVTPAPQRPVASYSAGIVAAGRHLLPVVVGANPCWRAPKPAQPGIAYSQFSCIVVPPTPQASVRADCARVPVSGRNGLPVGFGANLGWHVTRPIDPVVPEPQLTAIISTPAPQRAIRTNRTCMALTQRDLNPATRHTNLSGCRVPNAHAKHGKIGKPPTPQGAIHADGAGRATISGRHLNPSIRSDVDWNITFRHVGDAQLTVRVVPPAPERTVGSESTSVRDVDTYIGPTGSRADPAGNASGHRVSHSQFAVHVGSAPAPQASVRSDRAGMERTSFDQPPVQSGSHPCRLGSVPRCRTQSEEADQVSSPAPQAPVDTNGTRMTATDGNLCPFPLAGSARTHPAGALRAIRHGRMPTDSARADIPRALVALVAARSSVGDGRAAARAVVPARRPLALGAARRGALCRRSTRCRGVRRRRVHAAVRRCAVRTCLHLSPIPPHRWPLAVPAPAVLQHRVRQRGHVHRP